VRVETAGGFGSGFFIAPDTLLTNAHVVGSNTTVSIRRPMAQRSRAGWTSARPSSTSPSFARPDPILLKRR
jgi:V8-like Glu-specific endopeptidase